MQQKMRLILAAAALEWLALPMGVLGQHEHADREQHMRRAENADTAKGPAAVERRLEHSKVTVSLQLTPLGTERDSVLREGEDVEVRIVLNDAATGHPLGGAYPASWVDKRETEAITPVDACHSKIESYIQGTLRMRPVIDLNSYFLLALNNGNNISVIDPFLGFGSSKLYTTVLLRSSGEDWVLTPGAQRLFVTMPRINAVAVVSTETWKVERTLAAGMEPTRIALQPDGIYLWVANDGAGQGGGSVTVFDALTLAPAATIPTGGGHHQFAFSGDSRWAFVTNHSAGTLSVINVRTLEKERDIRTGPGPVDVAYSAAFDVVHVADLRDGSISVIDATTHEVTARIQTAPGLVAAGFDPSGRWLFAVNAANHVYIVDAATKQLRYTVPFGERPDQVSFTHGFAYVRSTGTVEVGMIPLGVLGTVDSVPVIPFPAGELPPAKFEQPGRVRAMASPIASDPHAHDAVYVPNPADKSIYYYHYMEGMPTPSGRLNNYGFEPKAVMVVGRDLRERTPGVYTTTIKAPPPGHYNLLLLVDEPRVVHCFDFSVDSSSVSTKDTAKRNVRLALVGHPGQFPVGDTTTVDVRLLERAPEGPVTGVDDLVVMLASTRGWQSRLRAREVGEGMYRVKVVFPAPGIYYVYVASPELRIRFQDQQPVTLRAVRPE